MIDNDSRPLEDRLSELRAHEAAIVAQQMEAERRSASARAHLESVVSEWKQLRARIAERDEHHVREGAERQKLEARLAKVLEAEQLASKKRIEAQRLVDEFRAAEAFAAAERSAAEARIAELQAMIESAERELPELERRLEQERAAEQRAGQERLAAETRSKESQVAEERLSSQRAEIQAQIGDEASFRPPVAPSEQSQLEQRVVELATLISQNESAVRSAEQELERSRSEAARMRVELEDLELRAREQREARAKAEAEAQRAAAEEARLRERQRLESMLAELKEAQERAARELAALDPAAPPAISAPTPPPAAPVAAAPHEKLTFGIRPGDSAPTPPANAPPATDANWTDFVGSTEPRPVRTELTLRPSQDAPPPPAPTQWPEQRNGVTRTEISTHTPPPTSSRIADGLIHDDMFDDGDFSLPEPAAPANGALPHGAHGLDASDQHDAGHAGSNGALKNGSANGVPSEAAPGASSLDSFLSNGLPAAPGPSDGFPEDRFLSSSFSSVPYPTNGQPDGGIPSANGSNGAAGNGSHSLDELFAPLNPETPSDHGGLATNGFPTSGFLSTSLPAEDSALPGTRFAPDRAQREALEAAERISRAIDERWPSQTPAPADSRPIHDSAEPPPEERKSRFSLFGKRKSEPEPVVDEGGMSISDRIGRDFGFLSEPPDYMQGQEPNRDFPPL